MTMRPSLFQQTYMRLFLIMMLILCLAIVPFSYFLANEFGKLAYHEIAKNNNEKLGQVVSNTEFILHRIKAYGLALYKNQNISSWLNAEQADKMLDANAVNELTHYLNTEPFIAKVYLINLKNRQVIDSETGISDFSQFEDLGLIKSIRQNDQSYLTFTDHTTGGASFPTLIVPADPAKNAYNGYLVAMLDRKTVETYLLQRNENIGIKVIVLDAGGKLIMGKEDPLIISRLNPYMSQTTGTKEFQISNGKKSSLSVILQRMQSQNWGFYYITDMSEWKSSISSFRKKLVFFTSVLLLLLLFVVFWGLRKTYGPITQLAAQLGSKMRENAVRMPNQPLAEYKVLKTGIDYLSNALEDMNQSMKNNLELVKDQYLRDWVLIGKVNKTSRDSFEKETKLFQNELLYVIVIRIDYYKFFCDHNTFSSRKLIKYAMANIADEILREKEWDTETIDMGEDHIVCLLSSKNENQRLIIDALQDVTEKIHHYLKISTVAAISESQPFTGEIHSVYDRMIDLTMLKFISGKDKIFTEADANDFKVIVRTLSENSVLEDMIRSLQGGHLNPALYLMDKLFEPMYNLSFQECKFHLTNILYAIIKAFNHFSIKKFENISETLDSFATLDEVKRWLNMQFVTIAQQLNMPAQINKKEEIVREIVDYIKHHIQDPQMNVDGIASHAALSVNYVRQIFREVYDVTLSDYIQTERLTHVKKLLATTEWTITNIAECSGYQSMSHFFTLFKKNVGMTPSEYREIYYKK